MKNAVVLFFLLSAFAFSSCKKSSSSSPSIVGTWKISNITGSYTHQNTPTSLLTTTAYSYSSNTLTETDTTSITTITVYDETWAFNSDGTFSIDENYEQASATVPTTHSLTGWWDYTGSTIPNSDVLLRSISTPSLVPSGGTFYIASVSNTQLVLTVKESSSLSTGASTITNLTLTFTKM